MRGEDIVCERSTVTDEEKLWENMKYFLEKIIPVCEECDVRMAIHPDDPPYPIFGLPRIITCEKNLDRFLSLVDSPANSLCDNIKIHIGRISFRQRKKYCFHHKRLFCEQLYPFRPYALNINLLHRRKRC